MPRKSKTDAVITSRGTEKSLIRAINDITNDNAETYYIIFLYAPEVLSADEPIETYEQLEAKYTCFADRTKQNMEKSLLKDDVQAGIRYLLKRLDGKRDVDLLNKYYQLAMGGDVQALKAYMDFKKVFFKDGEVDELKAILQGTNIDDD